MQVSSSQTDIPFSGIVATAVMKDNKAWTTVGSFDPPSPGYTILDCNDAVSL